MSQLNRTSPTDVANLWPEELTGARKDLWDLLYQKISEIDDDDDPVVTFNLDDDIFGTDVDYYSNSNDEVSYHPSELGQNQIFIDHDEQSNESSTESSDIFTTLNSNGEYAETDSTFCQGNSDYNNRTTTRNSVDINLRKSYVSDSSSTTDEDIFGKTFYKPTENNLGIDNITNGEYSHVKAKSDVLDYINKTLKMTIDMRESRKALLEVKKRKENNNLRIDGLNVKSSCSSKLNLTKTISSIQESPLSSCKKSSRSTNRVHSIRPNIINFNETIEAEQTICHTHPSISKRDTTITMFQPANITKHSTEEVRGGDENKMDEVKHWLKFGYYLRSTGKENVRKLSRNGNESDCENPLDVTYTAYDFQYDNKVVRVNECFEDDSIGQTVCSTPLPSKNKSDSDRTKLGIQMPTMLNISTKEVAIMGNYDSDSVDTTVYILDTRAGQSATKKQRRRCTRKKLNNKVIKNKTTLFNDNTYFVPNPVQTNKIFGFHGTESKLESYQNEKDKNNDEMHSPHELFNQLNSTSDLVPLDDVVEDDIITSFINESKLDLNFSPTYNPVTKEKEIMDTYNSSHFVDIINSYSTDVMQNFKRCISEEVGVRFVCTTNDIPQILITCTKDRREISVNFDDFSKFESGETYLNHLTPRPKIINESRELNLKKRKANYYEEESSKKLNTRFSPVDKTFYKKSKRQKTI